MGCSPGGSPWFLLILGRRKPAAPRFRCGAIARISAPLICLDHASAARLTVLLCFAHCCRAVGTATANSYCLGSFRKEECCPMRAHLDKKPSDGAAIGFFVITLLSPFALAILLSRLNAFF
jgi:hypothetical protein